VTREISYKAWLFSLACNDPELNQCAPVITMGESVNAYILYNIRLLFRLDGEYRYLTFDYNTRRIVISRKIRKQA
jgi:hypothetical protein